MTRFMWELAGYVITFGILGIAGAFVILAMLAMARDTRRDRWGRK